MIRLDKPVTVFEYRSGQPMPEYFVIRYEDEISAWGANFGKIGPIKTIVLREGRFADVSPNVEQGAVLLGVRLAAEVTRGGKLVTVRPLSDQDEALIARHCEKMEGHGVRAKDVLFEPARPGIPILPRIMH